MNEDFELPKNSSDLIKSLEDKFGSKCLIRLSLDVQLPSRLRGDLQGFEKSIETICQFLTANLINGLVDIEITKAGHHNGSITVSVEVRGSDATQKNYHIANNKTTNDLAWIQAIPYDTLFKIEDKKYCFSFKVVFNVIEQASEGPSSQKNILIADDNEINTLVFSSFLEVWGLKVTVVNNGEDALTKVSQEVFDLILMDIYMPKMNGIEATKKIRAINPLIPIVILTASSLGTDVEEAIKSGANNYLIKPVSSIMLKAILDKYL